MSSLPMILPPDSVPAGLVRESQLLHHYAADDLDPGLTPASWRNVLHAPTTLRAGSAWAVSANGRVYRTPADLPRFEWYDLDGDGILETPTLVVEDAETNLCPHSDFLTQWTVNFSATASVHDTVGETQMYRVDDIDATNASYLSKTLSGFTGATAKGVVVVWGRGTISAASGAWLRMRSITGGVDLLNATVVANADGSPAPSIVGGAGTYQGARYLLTVAGVRYYALYFSTNSVTVAHTHEARLGAAVTGSQQGNVYWGSITITDDLRTASVIDRGGVGSVSRAREVVGWLAPYVTTGAQSWSVDFLEVGASATSGSVLAALSDANGAAPSLAVTVNASGRYTVTHNNGLVSVLSAAQSTPAFLSRVRLLVWLFDDGSVQIGQSVNGGAIVMGTRSAANTPGIAWGVAASTSGFYLQPAAGFVKAKTRLLGWKVSGGTLTDTKLLNRW